MLPRRDDKSFDFSPQKLLTAAELRRLASAFIRIEKNRAAGVTGAKSTALHEHCNGLAEAVLGRETGLEMYMVVDITPEGGPRCVLQVLAIELEVTTGGTWQWNLGGRLGRKNGTLGTVRDRIYLSGPAVVKRRCLDGTWKPLPLTGEKSDPG